MSEDLERRVSKIESAFPDFDFSGHKRFHETQIELLNERRRLRIAIQEKTISALLWSAIVGTIMWCWNHFLMWLHPS